MGRGDFDVAKFGAEPGRFGGVPVREVGGIRTGSYLQSSSSIQPVRAPVFPFSNGGERGMAATEIRASRKRLLSAYVPVELYERVARIAAENERQSPASCGWLSVGTWRISPFRRGLRRRRPPC
jgi:hypothetical protein